MTTDQGLLAGGDDPGRGCRDHRGGLGREHGGLAAGRRGLRVIGIDRFPVPGPFSAYAGESRVFRMVYAEGGHYTPLLQRARDLWRELEAASGASC